MAAEFPGMLLRPVEALLNRGLAASATATALAAELEGKSLLIRPVGLPLPVRLAIAGGRASLAAVDDPADVVIAGSPLALLRLLGSDAQSLLREGELSLTGSTELASRFQELLRFAAPDLEDLLSRAVGDPAAHQVGEAAREMLAFASRAAGSFARSLGEYLTEERRSAPTRFEVDEFAAAVDELVSAVDRAEARLAILQARSRPGPS
jgi:ubiquinone biosynthesis accessory factor UbiJ